MGRGLEHGGVGGSFSPSRALEIRIRIRVRDMICVSGAFGFEKGNRLEGFLSRVEWS